MSACRNCGRNDMQDLGCIGRVNAFFLKRVLGIELRRPRSADVLKQTVRNILAFPTSNFSRVTGPFAYVEMQLCSDCSFVQTTTPFHDDDISRLYNDYRSSSYHQERIKLEPEYAAIAAAVGYHPLELQTRTTALKDFLRRLLPQDPVNILDYGGSDGRFIPDVPGAKFVYEVSNIDPIPGVTRLTSEAELGTYSVVLLAHVTEHVPHPLNLVRKLKSYVEPGGHLYIETPQEMSDQQRSDMRNRVARFDIGIHEHINNYCPSAVSSLLQAAGLAVVAIEREYVDIGWAKGVHIRALGRRPLAPVI